MVDLTLSQMIGAVTEFTAGPGGTISSEQLTVYREAVADELTRINPGFAGNALLRLESYLIADLITIKDPDSNIQSEKIGDHQWTFSKSSTSTKWMEKALQYAGTYTPDFGGVARSDSRMKSMSSDRIRPEEFGSVDTTYTDQEWEQDYES